MKLFTKYNRINIAVSIIVFVVGSVAFGAAIESVNSETGARLRGAAERRRTAVIRHAEQR